MTTPATTQPTTAPVDNTLVQTREALHAVAEHVLAAVRYRDAGRIGLTVTPGGFSTPLSGTGGRAVGIDGVALRAADINYGASPGDEYVTMPYLYVALPLRRAPLSSPAVSRRILERRLRRLSDLEFRQLGRGRRRVLPDRPAEGARRMTGPCMHGHRRARDRHVEPTSRCAWARLPRCGYSTDRAVDAWRGRHRSRPGPAGRQ